MKKPGDLAVALKALGDSTRLRIMELLKSRGQSCCGLISRHEHGLCACDIEQAIGLSQAAVSHHMAILVRVGLVTAEKRGRWMYYRRNEAGLARLAEAVKVAV